MVKSSYWFCLHLDFSRSKPFDKNSVAGSLLERCRKYGNTRKVRQKRKGSQEMVVYQASNHSGQLEHYPPGWNLAASAEHSSELAPTKGERARVFTHQLLSKDDSGDINSSAFLACLVRSKAGPRGEKTSGKEYKSAAGSLAREHWPDKGERYGQGSAKATRY